MRPATHFTPRPISLVILAALLVLDGAMARGQQAAPSAVDTAIEVLDTLMTTPGEPIPARLLADAHGVAIIPDVLKGGFVVGVRRGHGIVLARDDNGAWQAPTFVTLTGGSFGWQAGVQSTDLVLVFKNRRSIQNLFREKLTIGVDASVAAGPVGRQAQAATDGRLAAEIFSYSRSRGLFAGVSVDGATLQLDRASHDRFYGATPGMMPPSVEQLIARLNRYSRGGEQAPVALGPPGEGAPLERLMAAERRLQPLLDETWREFLRLPLPQGGAAPSLPALQSALRRYDDVSRDARYESLQRREEFGETHQLLRQYVLSLVPRESRLQLPPPPMGLPR